MNEDKKGKMKVLFPDDIETITISKNDYDRLYGNLTYQNIELQQENARLKDKLIEIKKVIDGYMPNEHAMCKAFDEIEFILKEN